MYRSKLVASAPATAQKNINLGILDAVLIPLPPLGELKRIVEKVEALTSLLDQLEVALQTEQQITSRLLDALIAETLSESPDPETVETKTQLALSD